MLIGRLLAHHDNLNDLKLLRNIVVTD